jgi:hypothetical protein
MMAAGLLLVPGVTSPADYGDARMTLLTRQPAFNLCHQGAIGMGPAESLQASFSRSRPLLPIANAYGFLAVDKD